MIMYHCVHEHCLHAFRSLISSFPCKKTYNYTDGHSLVEVKGNFLGRLFRIKVHFCKFLPFNTHQLIWPSFLERCFCPWPQQVCQLYEQSF